MALRTALCIYGWCPSCKKFHYYLAHGYVDESDLPLKCDCGSEIIWDEMHQHNFPIPEEGSLSGKKSKKRALSPPKALSSLSPVEGFELGVMVFSLCLLSVIGCWIHFGIGEWPSPWKWAAVGLSVVFILFVWLLERTFMRRITERTLRRSLEEGRLQGRYLERKEKGESRDNGKLGIIEDRIVKKDAGTVVEKPASDQ